MRKAGILWFKKNSLLLAALVIGGLVRAFFLFWFFADLQSDPDAYKQIAVNVRTQGIYGQKFGADDSGSSQPTTVVQPTAFRPPLYPLLLSLFVNSGDDPPASVSRLGIATLHWCLGIGTLLLAFNIGRNHQLSEPYCLLLALLVACDPIALRQSCLPMTETIAIFLATLGLWIFSLRRSASRVYFFGVGFLLGTFTLCRPTFLIWGGLLFLVILAGWFTANREDVAKRTKQGMVFLLGIGLALLPWTIRNYVVFGKPIFATSHGGYTVFLGNNDSFYDYLETNRNSTWNGEKELQAIVVSIRRASLKESEKGWIVDEVVKDRLYYEQAKEVIVRRPLDFLYACAVRVVRFWSIVPKRSANEFDSKEAAAPEGFAQWVLRLASGIWYGVMYLFAAMGAFRLATLGSKGSETRRVVWNYWLPGMMLVVAFQGLHLIYWSNMRMRAPLVVLIALLAVIGLSGPRWVKRLCAKFHQDR